ncbi:hypothetical protein KR044_013422, partial [Drosophila immigrans]
CNALWRVSNKNLSVEELATLQTLASILFLLPDNDMNLRKGRNILLSKTFQIRASLEPMLIHFFTDNLLNHFKLSRAGVGFVLSIATFICRKNALGHAVAVCLLWSIVFSCAESDAILHQYHDLSELSNTLVNVPIEHVSLDTFYFLVHSVGCLLHMLLCNKWQSEFVAFGYPASNFRLLPKDARKLQAWIEEIKDYFRTHTKAMARRIRYEAAKVLDSLHYLEVNSLQWCHTCHSGATDEICVLGEIDN